MLHDIARFCKKAKHLDLPFVVLLREKICRQLMFCKSFACSRLTVLSIKFFIKKFTNFYTFCLLTSSQFLSRKPRQNPKRNNPEVGKKTHDGFSQIGKVPPSSGKRVPLRRMNIDYICKPSSADGRSTRGRNPHILQWLFVNKLT